MDSLLFVILWAALGVASLVAAVFEWRSIGSKVHGKAKLQSIIAVVSEVSFGGYLLWLAWDELSILLG